MAPLATLENRTIFWAKCATYLLMSRYLALVYSKIKNNYVEYVAHGNCINTGTRMSELTRDTPRPTSESIFCCLLKSSFERHDTMQTWRKREWRWWWDTIPWHASNHVICAAKLRTIMWNMLCMEIALMPEHQWVNRIETVDRLFSL